MLLYTALYDVFLAACILANDILAPLLMHKMTVLLPNDFCIHNYNLSHYTNVSLLLCTRFGSISDYAQSINFIF